MIYEFNSTNEFNKLKIALKEAGETSYWIKLLHRTEYFDDSMYKSVMKDCDELIRLLIASINTASSAEE